MSTPTPYLIVARDNVRVAYWHGPWWENDPAGAAVYTSRDAAEDALVDAQATGAPDTFDDRVEIRIERTDACPHDQPTCALLALARIELDSDPATWPLNKLGGEGFAAAAIVTDRVDLLPEHLADPATAWRTLRGPFRALIKQRNPAMAVYCEQATRGDRA